MNNIFHRDSKLMNVMTWISDMVHVQVLWILLTLLGLIMGGFFPATYSLFSVHRKLIQTSGGINKNKVFWREYKQNFVKSNIIGYSIVILIITSLVHLQFSLNIQNILFYVSSIVSLGLILVVSLLSIYVWPVAAHFEISVFEIFKHALIIIISFPLHTLGVIGSTVVFLWSSRVIPVLLPFFSIPAYSYVVMLILNHAFRSIKKSSENPSE